MGYRAQSNEPGTFFTGQCWADYIITMSGIDLRQAHQVINRKATPIAELVWFRRAPSAARFTDPETIEAC
jgi:hypothetical protein